MAPPTRKVAYVSRTIRAMVEFPAYLMLHY